MLDGFQAVASVSIAMDHGMGLIGKAFEISDGVGHGL